MKHYRKLSVGDIVRYCAMVISNQPEDEVLPQIVATCPWAARVDCLDDLGVILAGIAKGLPAAAQGQLDRIDLVGHAGSACLQLGDPDAVPDDTRAHFIHTESRAINALVAAIAPWLRPGGELRLLGCQTAVTPARSSALSLKNDGLTLCETIARHSGYVVYGTLTDVVAPDFETEGLKASVGYLQVVQPMKLADNDPLGDALAPQVMLAPALQPPAPPALPAPPPPPAAPEPTRPLLSPVVVPVDAVLLLPETPNTPTNDAWPWTAGQAQLAGVLDGVTTADVVRLLSGPVAPSPAVLGLRRRLRRIVTLDGAQLGEVALVGNGEVVHVRVGGAVARYDGRVLVETVLRPVQDESGNDPSTER